MPLMTAVGRWNVCEGLPRSAVWLMCRRLFLSVNRLLRGVLGLGDALLGRVWSDGRLAVRRSRGLRVDSQAAARAGNARIGPFAGWAVTTIQPERLQVTNRNCGLAGSISK